jgi:hypothetical protein
MKSTNRRRTLATAAPGKGRLRSSLAAVTLAAAAMMGLATACDADLRDHECSSGEYPVLAANSLNGAGACVTNGEEPPAGYVRYPKGQVPERVGDKWDVYWQTHGLDIHGHPIKN